jgi:hypothetical protein
MGALSPVWSSPGRAANLATCVVKFAICMVKDAASMNVRPPVNIKSLIKTMCPKVKKTWHAGCNQVFNGETPTEGAAEKQETETGK